MNSKRQNITPQKQTITSNHAAHSLVKAMHDAHLPILPQGPAMTITETTVAVIVTVPLPGIRINEVVVEVVARKLTIKGYHQRSDSTAMMLPSNQETDVSTFFQSVTLPDSVNVRNISSKLVNGVLTITFFKVQDSSLLYSEENM